ncbi:DUF443 family protein, partial [Staphylococcus aureus]|uniref:DUF443 family protein n=1 Tax=Staphylococcus aureus TaxID=1280 RepID=UPI0021483AF3
CTVKGLLYGLFNFTQLFGLYRLCLSIVLYIYLGGGSFFTIYMLLTIEVQNIILFITLFVIFLFFLFLNMCSLYDNKVHVLFKSNGIEKF